MPMVATIIAGIWAFIKGVKWSSVLLGFFGGGIANGIPLFAKQQALDWNTTVKRATAIPTIIGAVALVGTAYLIIKEFRRK